MENDLLLRALAREPTPRTPIWLMRQAGRALPEYRELRQRYGFRELQRDPVLAARVTLMPVERLGVDAAILFADLATPLDGMNVRYQIREGEGPVMERPFSGPEDLARLRHLEPEQDVPYVLETIRRVRERSPVPLIGFLAGPYTLATYLIEGRGRRDHPRTRALMYAHPDLWNRLMDHLVDSLIRYGRAQIKAGVQVIQVFDSWAGDLSRYQYRHAVLGPTRRLVQALQQQVPVIYFSTGTAGLLELLRGLEATCYGVDWRLPILEAWRQVGWDRAIQGNLDPAALLGGEATLREQVARILNDVGHRPGHIFNLGHGVLPETPVERLQALVRWVHELSQQIRGTAGA